MTRQEMIDLIGWHYQAMTEEEKNILSRVEHIVEVSVLREREACAKACPHCAPRPFNPNPESPLHGY